jgi:hypothetical protein
VFQNLPFESRLREDRRGWKPELFDNSVCHRIYDIVSLSGGGEIIGDYRRVCPGRDVARSSWAYIPDLKAFGVDALSIWCSEIQNVGHIKRSEANDESETRTIRGNGFFSEWGFGLLKGGRGVSQVRKEKKNATIDVEHELWLVYVVESLTHVGGLRRKI